MALELVQQKISVGKVTCAFLVATENIGKEMRKMSKSCKKCVK